MIKTLITSVTLAILTQTALPQTDSNQWAYCDASYRAAGGVKAVIPIYTNLVTGDSIVLPIKVKMCDEVTNNSAWYVGYNFGPKVKILPELTVDVSPGYVYYDSTSTYYSSKYPILIEATTNLCSPPCSNWFTNYYFCLYAARSQDGRAGPCQVSQDDNHMGSIDGKLYSGSNTNGLDMVTTSGPDITNSLMGRFGPAACDNRDDNFSSRSSVAFLYFNLPPRVPTGYYCQNSTNFFQYPYEGGMCGYTPDYVPGFGYGWNEDNCQNWTNYPAPCDTNLFREKLFRVRCDGSTNCQSGTPPPSALTRKLTR